MRNATRNAIGYRIGKILGAVAVAVLVICSCGHGFFN